MQMNNVRVMVQTDNDTPKSCVNICNDKLSICCVGEGISSFHGDEEKFTQMDMRTS